MASKLFLLLTAFAAMTTSFTIPEGQPDGVYVHHPEDNTHTKLSDIGSSPAAPKLTSAKFKRYSNLPSPDVNCGAVSVTSLDSASAQQSFNNGCVDQNIPEGTNYYALSGDAVVYMCTYDGKNPCGASEARDAESLLLNKCGHGGTGWVMILKWKKSYGIGAITGSICSNE